MPTSLRLIKERGDAFAPFVPPAIGGAGKCAAFAPSHSPARREFAAASEREEFDVAPTPSHAVESNADGAATVESAREEASRIIAEAEARAAEIEREAVERGLAEGRERMAQEVARSVEPLRDALVSTLEEVEGLRAEIAARAERELVQLAIEIARKIVHREVSVDHEIALTLARVALARLHSHAIATLHLHPDDYNYVAAQRERLDASGAIELVEDRSVGRGGCLVRTEMGDIDARIEHQFAEIARGFFNQ